MLKLRVHILTDNDPEVQKTAEGFIVGNALIGKDFHWQQNRPMTFSGNCEITPQGLINTIDIEDYLKSVIASEMNPEAPIEFLKAHAVISRSWAVGKVVGNKNGATEGKSRRRGVIIGWEDTEDHQGFHICNDDHCQRYQGIPEDEKLKLTAEKAVRETEGLILTDRDGKVADARFSKHCGGHTELFSTCWQETDYHYLKAFLDPFCDLSDMKDSDRAPFLASILKDYDAETPFDSWVHEVSFDEIENNIRQKFNYNTGKVHGLKVLKQGPSGRIRETLIEAENPLILGKELYIRRALSPSHLYSSLFEIEEMENGLLLRGKGWGHGVGLCQIGAARMAREGADYRQILAFYYPETKITHLSDSAEIRSLQDYME